MLLTSVASEPIELEIAAMALNECQLVPDLFKTFRFKLQKCYFLHLQIFLYNFQTFNPPCSRMGINSKQRMRKGVHLKGPEGVTLSHPVGERLAGKQ